MMDNKRLVSLDVFRGMVIAAMILVNFPGTWKVIYAPLEHAPWEGTTPTDYIFPFFIFMVGLSVALSYSKQLSQGKTKSQMVQKTLLRTLKIFLLGVFIHLLPTLDFSRIELPGVLQRIALVFLACAMLFLYTDWKVQLYAGTGILIAYWLAMNHIPVPQFGAGVLEPGKNLANWMDGLVIPASLLNKKGYDAEGFLSTFPAIVSGISGLIAGKIILRSESREKNVNTLFVIGIVLVFSGTIWGWSFPVIKKIWTSSFVLLTSGWAFMVFASLMWLIEIKNIQRGTIPWVIFGSNAIATYVLADVFETIFLKTGLHDGTMAFMQDIGIQTINASLIWAIFSVLVCYLAAWALYSRKIFIKL
ncbi:MAG: heparan-alpha-glucosaminide N-acetyltransferase domain-containing protein [Prolixibacteraceae bacterium]